MKTVYLDKTSGWLIYDITNTTSTRDKYMLGKYWTMTKEVWSANIWICLKKAFDLEKKNEEFNPLANR